VSGHPFDWLPKVGQKKEIPGGVIFCEEWVTNQSRYGEFDGRVTFRFFGSIQAREKWEREQAERLKLENPQLGEGWPKLEGGAA